MMLLQASALLFIASSETPDTHSELSDLLGAREVKYLIDKQYVYSENDRITLSHKGYDMINQLNRVINKSK